MAGEDSKSSGDGYRWDRNTGNGATKGKERVRQQRGTSEEQQHTSNKSVGQEKESNRAPRKTESTTENKNQSQRGIRRRKPGN
jgi:hypothetical protein